MTQVYITNQCTADTFIAIFRSISTFFTLTSVYILCLMLTIQFINWLLVKILNIDITAQITKNIESNTTLYLLGVIMLNMILYKIFLVIKFQTDIQQYNEALSLIIIIISLSVVVHSYFKTISLITFAILAFIYSTITIVAYIEIITDSYLIITCKTYKSNLYDTIVPIYYTCNLPNGKLLLHISPHGIFIKQIPLSECIANLSVQQYFQNEQTFFLDCDIKDNIITKQTIYDTNGKPQNDFQYKIDNNSNIFTHVFKELKPY
jgi:hypothetical protein